MDTDWESVLQFVSEPMDMDFSPAVEKPVAGLTERVKLPLPSPQIPTPPVRVSLADLVYLTELMFYTVGVLHRLARG